jgi:hypothetical protein
MFPGCNFSVPDAHSNRTLCFNRHIAKCICNPSRVTTVDQGENSTVTQFVGDHNSMTTTTTDSHNVTINNNVTINVTPFGKEDFSEILGKMSVDIGAKLIYNAMECLTQFAPQLLWQNSDTTNEKIRGNETDMETQSGNPIPKDDLLDIAMKFSEAMCQKVYEMDPNLHEYAASKYGWDAMRKATTNGVCSIAKDNPCAKVFFPKQTEKEKKFLPRTWPAKITKEELNKQLVSGLDDPEAECLPVADVFQQFNI